MASQNPKTIAAQNEAIIEAGSYTAPDGTNVQLNSAVTTARTGTRSYTPDDTANILTAVRKEAPPTGRLTTIEVTDESSMESAHRLAVDEGIDQVAVLNFASARNPGGGYLGGARAQEEDLCRVSALYTTLLEAPDYYEAHRADRDARYSHRVIWSPDVPVIRDTQYRLLDKPYAVSFLTSPAPNAGTIARDQRNALSALPKLISERAARVLAVAAHHRAHTLILGAWGCGVFRNNPTDVAAAFYWHLNAGGHFQNRFARIVFAVLDHAQGQPNLTAFERAFGEDAA
jgi:uncharacterized protein (TIGR02452 family)